MDPQGNASSGVGVEKDGKFKTAKEIVSRDKSVKCDVFNEDLASLKE